MGDTNVSLRLRDTLSGAFGSVCLTYAGLPFDVVKLRMQTSTLVSSTSSAVSTVSSPALSPFQTARTIVTQEGITRLWRGAGPALTSAMVENTVVFTANGFFTRLYANIIGNGRILDEDNLSFTEHFALGGLSGIFSATAICPPEVIKCRLQYHRNLQPNPSSVSTVSNGAYRNGWTCAKYIYRTEGMKGFFSGLLPLLYRDVPFNTLFFGFYRVYSYVLTASFFTRPTMPNNYGTHDNNDKNSSNGGGLRAFLAGGFAGMTAWAIIFPFDVIKTKMQVLGSQVSGNGTFRLLQQIVQNEGIKRLYYGATPAILRAFPANAALFWGVETAKSVLKDVGLE